MTLLERYPNSVFVKRLYAGEDALGSRSRIEQLFSALEGLEDSHFGTELDRDPYSRLWEMLVASLLRASGHNPSSADEGPDFICHWRYRRVVVEAICPGPGDLRAPDSVPELKYGTRTAQLIPIDALVLRIAAAVRDKQKQIALHRERGLIRDDDCVVIAVSSAKLHRGTGIWPCLGVRALLGYGSPYAIFSRDDSGPVREGIEGCLEVMKLNGASVSTATFPLARTPGISAVIYSDACPLSVPFDPTNQSWLIHNPTCDVPLQRGFLGLREVWTFISPAEQHWRAQELAATDRNEAVGALAKNP